MKIDVPTQPKKPFKLPTTAGEKTCVICGKTFKTSNARAAKYCPDCKKKRSDSQ